MESSVSAFNAGGRSGRGLYGHLDEVGFRKVVLVLLLVSGVALVAPVITPWFSM